MDIYKSLVFIVISSCISLVAHADQTYVCTYGQKERVIAVVYDDQSSEVPCEVRYTKNGITSMLWRATTKTGYCEEQAKDMVKLHVQWGWRCGGEKQGQLPAMSASQEPQQAVVEHYRRNAYIHQAISVASIFRIQIMEYRGERGQYPKSIEELGYKKEDMRNSMYIADLRIGEEGTILIKGNEKIGTDTVIALKPVDALGGASIEWKCYINIKVNDVSNCTYKQGLSF